MRIYRHLYQLMRLGRPHEYLGRRYLRELERNQWLSQPELRQVEWQKLKMLIQHAYTNVPFYRQRFQQLGITPADIQTREDFGRIPLLSKNDIRANQEAMIAQNYAKSQLRRDSTSGSTGIPLVVYLDKHRVPIDNAAFARSRRWFGIEVGDKAAWIWGRRDDLPNDSRFGHLITTLKRERWLNAFRVSDEEMQHFAEMLVKWQPDYLVGYATSVYHFARYVSNQHIQGLCFKAVETTAGTLWPYQRQKIEETFTCKVFDRYGSHEVGHIAAECEYGRMHIFSDVAYVEVLERDNSTPDSNIGEIIITPLYSYGMPLIRFRIGDLGILETQSCPCGRSLPVLREVTGRINSIIVLPSGKYLYGGIFLTIMEDILEIQQFRIHQIATDKLEIWLAKGSGFSQETINLVHTRVIKLLGSEPVTVSIKATDEIPPTAAGKYLVTTSDVPVDF